MLGETPGHARGESVNTDPRVAVPGKPRNGCRNTSEMEGVNGPVPNFVRQRGRMPSRTWNENNAILQEGTDTENP